jgi:hypothetical protein
MFHVTHRVPISFASRCDLLQFGRDRPIVQQVIGDVIHSSLVLTKSSSNFLQRVFLRVLRPCLESLERYKIRRIYRDSGPYLSVSKWQVSTFRDSGLSFFLCIYSGQSLTLCLFAFLSFPLQSFRFADTSQRRRVISGWYAAFIAMHRSATLQRCCNPGMCNGKESSARASQLPHRAVRVGANERINHCTVRCAMA